MVLPHVSNMQHSHTLVHHPYLDSSQTLTKPAPKQHMFHIANLTLLDETEALICHGQQNILETCSGHSHHHYQCKTSLFRPVI